MSQKDRSRELGAGRWPVNVILCALKCRMVQILQSFLFLPLLDARLLCLSLVLVQPLLRVMGYDLIQIDRMSGRYI